MTSAAKIHRILKAAGLSHSVQYANHRIRGSPMYRTEGFSLRRYDVNVEQLASYPMWRLRYHLSTMSHWSDAAERQRIGEERAIAALRDAGVAVTVHEAQRVSGTGRVIAVA